MHSSASPVSTRLFDPLPKYPRDFLSSVALVFAIRAAGFGSTSQLYHFCFKSIFDVQIRSTLSLVCPDWSQIQMWRIDLLSPSWSDAPTCVTTNQDCQRTQPGGKHDWYINFFLILSSFCRTKFCQLTNLGTRLKCPRLTRWLRIIWLIERHTNRHFSALSVLMVAQKNRYVSSFGALAGLLRTVFPIEVWRDSASYFDLRTWFSRFKKAWLNSILASGTHLRPKKPSCKNPKDWDRGCFL